jgi:putative transposase
MNMIDVVYTEFPYYGWRRIRHALKRGYQIDIGRKRIRRLMTEMGIEAIYPKPHTSKGNKEHVIYPYLLKGLKIKYPNQVWGSDITYLRLENGCAYLTAIIDWYSRYVISWRLSKSLESGFCVEALDEALAKGLADIHNSDQGVQFTSGEYTGKLKEHEVRISMDGRGRCMDNIFTERLWRSVKYEDVYIKSYRTIEEAREGLGNYFHQYNTRRLHQSLNYKTPAEIYCGGKLL